MFRKRAGKEPPEMPQPRLEDEVGVKETVIASDTKARGTIQGRNSVRVAGSFEGEISIDGVVWIEKQGEVQGTVRARDMIIEGQMKGDIDSSERIEVRASGRVTGKLRCNKLAVAEGCFLQGEIKMPGEESQPLTVVQKEEERQRRRRAGNG